MKNKLLMFSVICLLFVSFTVIADTEPMPQITENGQMPQRGMPRGEMPSGDFEPGQPPQGDRGTPPGDMQFVPSEEVSEQTETPATPVELVPENTENTEIVIEEEQETEEKEQPVEERQQMPDINMEEGMGRRGQFKSENMQGFPIGQTNKAEQEAEKPYEKWITPIISVVLLVFGFVFVALYKRKQC